MSDTINVYKARFYGRKVGSLGVYGLFFTTVTGVDRRDAELRLYDRFEHISGLSMELSAVEPREKYPEFEATQSNNKNREQRGGKMRVTKISITFGETIPTNKFGNARPTLTVEGELHETELPQTAFNQLLSQGDVMYADLKHRALVVAGGIKRRASERWEFEGDDF